MELRELAERIVLGRSLEAKLAPGPRTLTDEHPRPLRLPMWPERPDDLAIVPVRDAAHTPPLEGMGDPAQRARIMHAFANHELQAAELYAWALLAYPDAPAEFRSDLHAILTDEQRHTRMYMSRCAALGLPFGSLTVSGYFWNKVESLSSPLRFACAMALTFENANLDHTIDYAAAARAAGDEASAAVIDKVHIDEVRHVHFGWTWLGRLKNDEESMWEAWCANVDWPLRPSSARGRVFHPQGRVAAGLDPEFIRLLETHEADIDPAERSRRRRA